MGIWQKAETPPLIEKYDNKHKLLDKIFPMENTRIQSLYGFDWKTVDSSGSIPYLNAVVLTATCTCTINIPCTSILNDICTWFIMVDRGFTVHVHAITLSIFCLAKLDDH